MEKFKDYMAKYSSVLTIILCVVAVVAVCFSVYGCMHPAQTVTQESQQEAETPAGVQEAAQAAKVPLTSAQATEAATQIRHIYESGTAPARIVYTTAQQAESTEKQEQAKSKADFAIVTDASDPNKKADVSSLPANTPVTLNQYNVQAYKKVLHTVEIGTNDFKGVDEVGYTVSRKISKDGKYLGIGASYNIEDKKTMVKVSYTW